MKWVRLIEPQADKTDYATEALEVPNGVVLRCVELSGTNCSLVFVPNVCLSKDGNTLIPINPGGPLDD